MITNPIYEKSDDSSNCQSVPKPTNKSVTVAEDHLYTDISHLSTNKNCTDNENHLYTDIDNLPKRRSQRANDDEGVEASNPLYATGDSL